MTFSFRRNDSSKPEIEFPKETESPGCETKAAAPALQRVAGLEPAAGAVAAVGKELGNGAGARHG